MNYEAALRNHKLMIIKITITKRDNGGIVVLGILFS